MLRLVSYMVVTAITIFSVTVVMAQSDSSPPPATESPGAAQEGSDPSTPTPITLSLLPTPTQTAVFVSEALSPPYNASTILPVRGKSMYYNPGIMQTVVRNRARMRHITPCTECIGYIAMLRVGDLNRRVWLQINDAYVEGPYLVADVADIRHVGRLVAIGWAIDVDYETARRWGFRMPIVTVLDTPQQTTPLTEQVVLTDQNKVD